MRAVKISFTAEMLLANSGIHKSLFMQMLDLLPPDAKIVGFLENGVSMCSDIFVTSSHFKMMADKYNLVPLVTLVAFTEANGDTYIKHIDFYDTIETPWNNVPKEETVKVTVRSPGNIRSAPVTITVPGLDTPLTHDQDEMDRVRKLWGMLP